MPLLESLSRSLSQFGGLAVGYLLAVLLYLFVVFLLWGFPWSRIIAKAGHKGKTYWTLLLLMFAPVAIAPLTEISADAAAFCGAIAGISFYLVIWFLALFPWRQVKPSVDRS